MSSNKMIFQCRNCGEMYCGECSENEDWQNFCSTDCEEEYKIETLYDIELAKNEY